MKILFLVPYPLGESPSQRFRFEQYFQFLKDNGYCYHVQSFLDPETCRLYFRSKNLAQTSYVLLKGFYRRTIILFQVFKFDFVFIHREAAPIGPPIFEGIISKILRKKIIYDFDDAIWLTDRNDESMTLRIVKWRSKVSSICRWSYKVSCGNDYLSNYARQFNDLVVYNPTTIETDQVHNPARYKSNSSTKIKIGWTGSHSTLKYLQSLETVLALILNKYSNVEFNVISDVRPKLALNRLNFVQWSAATEIDDLIKFDIGVMPLPDDEWAKGKCGFKALQYMALQIPAVVSPVGVNSEIIDHGKNGFLCSTPNEWEKCISLLIENKTLRDSMGISGRRFVIEHYAVSSNSANYLSLFS